MRSKPALTANWRLEPNMTAQVALGDSALTLAGIKINMASEAKPLIDREVNAQIGKLAGAAAQRSDHRAHRARAMDQDVPRHSARRRQDRPAQPVAGDAPGARRRRAAAGRCPQRDAHRRRAGRNPHRADADQAGLPVPGAARTGAADGERQARHRRADRRALHRTQQAAGSAAQGQTFSGRRQRGGAKSKCAAPVLPPPATGC